MRRVMIGQVPGGSGHAVHCSLLHHHGEKFSSEIPFSALSLARQKELQHDIIECQTNTRDFVSMFGVAWGIIPEVDLRSEFLRWMGPNRGYVLAFWKWLFPTYTPGTVHYLPHSEDNDDIQLPDINHPVPDDWKTVEVSSNNPNSVFSSVLFQGPFFNVYACKQPWLDYSLQLCPDAAPGDGKLWLVIMDASITHRDGAYWMLNAEKVKSSKFSKSSVFQSKSFKFHRILGLGCMY